MTGGDTVLVGVRLNPQTVTATITDSLGTAFASIAGPVNDPSGTFRGQLFKGTLSASGADTVKLTTSGSENCANLTIIEVSGTNGVIDGSPVFAPGNSTTISAGSVTTSVPNDLIVGTFSTWGMSSTEAAGSGYSVVPNTDLSNGQFSESMQAASTTGAFAVNESIGTALAWVGFGVALEPAPPTIGAMLTSPTDGTIYDDQTVQTADYAVTITTADALSNYQFDAQVANSLGAVVFKSPYMTPDPTLTPSQTTVSLDFSALPDDDYTVIFNLYQVSTSGGTVARRAVGEALAGL